MSVGVLTIGKQTWQSFSRNKGTRLGAALAYYTFASFFPLLLVLISLIGIILSFNIGGAHDASVVVIDTISKELPAATPLVKQNFQQTEQNSGIIGLIGLLTGLWAASNIFAQLEDAFVEIYDVPPETRNWKKTLKARAKAASIVLLLALLMVSSLVFSTVLKTADELVGLLPGGGYWVWLLNLGLSLGLTALVFAVLFEYLPDKVVTWTAALIGGMFTSLTWQIGRELLTAWLGNSGGATAGTVVGSVLAFLALIYYAWQILLLGAQLTATYDDLVHPHLVRQGWKEPEEESDNKKGVVVQKTKADLPSPNVTPALPAPEASTKKWQAVVPARRSNPISFGAGFFTGVMALFIGSQMLMNKLLKRKTTSGQAE
jgi:membrane protein